ncbi:N-acetyltransferase [Xinfangfangia sp. D13-10-4-6]|uniref:GNAT family N-acetyltransferase n=1 Tax=Pseudogemmobacter hezensis TaxID=2737662 RepID=UPI0015547A9B|nr:N-acetyltransferase [Pseudogemmobacter hezensis]NPD16191.1 N-acetyltransferase [Pseudogemmobacter hezensis]
MRIRDASPEDRAPIMALITRAFLTAPHRDGNEAELFKALEVSGALILSLLAGRGGELIGHLAASLCRIGTEGAFALIAPLSVAPEAQGAGIGAALMREALARLQAQGLQGAALVGDPGYYGRFGFAAQPGLTCAGIPDEFVLSLGFGRPAPIGALQLPAAFGDLASAGRQDP